MQFHLCHPTSSGPDMGQKLGAVQLHKTFQSEMELLNIEFAVILHA